ncbi:MAG: hypothetical protein RIF46_01600 [Cyclobacteriaceae bacterium]
MRLILNILFCQFTLLCFAQDELSKVANEILNKGLSLYRLEMASWQSTDSLNAEDKKRAEGYFSYRQNGILQSIYYDPSGEFAVKKFLFTEDSLVSVTIQEIEENVPLTSNETAIVNFTKKAKDMSVVWYSMQGWSEIVNPNIMVVKGDSDYEYICIPGAKSGGFTPIGGEIKHKFNSKNEWNGMDHLHNNLIPIEHHDDAAIASHNHFGKKLGKEYITPTDICTILLYQRWSNVDQHIVVHKKFISEFYPKTLKLVIRENKDKLRLEDIGEYVKNQTKTK